MNARIKAIKTVAAGVAVAGAFWACLIWLLYMLVSWVSASERFAWVREEGAKCGAQNTAQAVVCIVPVWAWIAAAVLVLVATAWHGWHEDREYRREKAAQAASLEEDADLFPEEDAPSMTTAPQPPTLARHAGRKTAQLLQRRSARLTVFVLALVLIPTLIAGSLTHYDNIRHAQRMCPVRGLLIDDAGVLGNAVLTQGLKPVHFTERSHMNTGTAVRCAYMVLVPTDVADWINTSPTLTPAMNLAIETAKTERGFAVKGVASDSQPSLVDSFSMWLWIAGALLSLYAALFLLVWGLVWVWRGPKKAVR